MSDGLSNQLAALKIDREERRSGGDGRWKKWLAALVVVALLAGAAVIAIPRIQARLDVVEIEVTRIGTVSASDALVSVTATGYVHALRTAYLGAETLTRITEVNVVEGQAVSAGDVLFVFDSSDFEATIDAAETRIRSARARSRVAEANVEMTRAQLARARGLAQSGVQPAAPAQDLELLLAVQEAQESAADAEVRAARADVASLEEGRDRFVVVAPFDGVVINSPAERGAVADPQQPLVELMDPASLVIEADIPEGRMAGVEDGAPCEIAFDAYPQDRYQGHVVGFAPRMDRARATATARIRVVAPPMMLPDMAARVRFLREELPEDHVAEPQTVVPASALADRDGNRVVFVVEGTTVRPIPVSLGDALGDGYVLLDGPEPGTPIVQRPPPTLRGGNPVREREL